MEKWEIVFTIEFIHNGNSPENESDFERAANPNAAELTFRFPIDADTANKIKTGEIKLVPNAKIVTTAETIEKEEPKKKKIILENSQKRKETEAQEIIYVKSDNIYSDVYTTDNDFITLSKNLKETEKYFDSALFLRVHRSYLINKCRIKSHSKTPGKYVILDNDIKINIGKTRKEAFFKEMKF